MQPLTPALREELLNSHPGLTPGAIDALEGLFSVRASIDATSDPEHAAAVDKQIAALIVQMPRYREVVFGTVAVRAGEEPRASSESESRLPLA